MCTGALINWLISTSRLLLLLGSRRLLLRAPSRLSWYGNVTHAVRNNDFQSSTCRRLTAHQDALELLGAPLALLARLAVEAVEEPP